MKRGARYVLLAGLGVASLFNFKAIGVWPEKLPDGIGDHSGKMAVDQRSLTPGQWERIRKASKYLAIVTILTASPGSLQTFNVPANYAAAGSSIETIAGGASGAAGGASGVNLGISGGGAGAYSKSTNVALTPGGTAQYQIGLGGTAAASGAGAVNGNSGGDSWFNGATLGVSSVGSKAGLAGNGGSGAQNGGLGGDQASGIASGTGSAKFSGGRGGNLSVGDGTTGGGGAAGPNGAGNNGVDRSVANSATAGGSGDAGSGGTAGAGNAGVSAGTISATSGGNGAEFGSAGSGGGGGGATNNGSGNATAGSAGSYGAAGGGAFSTSATGTSGAGFQGVIVVTFFPSPPIFGASVPVAVQIALLPPPPGPTFGRNVQPYQQAVLTPPISGPVPQNPPFPGSYEIVDRSGIQVSWIPPPPGPYFDVGQQYTSFKKAPPSTPTDPNTRGLGRSVAPWATFLFWDTATWSKNYFDLPHGYPQFWTPKRLVPPISGPPPQAPPIGRPRGSYPDAISVAWLPPPPLPQPFVANFLDPELIPPAPPPPSIAPLFSLFNDIVAGRNLGWCDFDLYTITLFNGLTLRFTTSDFDVFANGQTFDCDSVRVDQQESKVVAHWKVGLDVDTWMVVLMPRNIDIMTNATFPDQIGNVPWVQAAHSGYLDAADVQVDRAWFSPLPTWPIPPRGAVPVGTKTIFAGKIAAVDCTGLTVVLTLNDYRDLLTIQMPRHVYQAQCRHTLFDIGCNASNTMLRSRFAQTGVVGPGSTQNNIVPMARTNVIANSNNFPAWVFASQVALIANAASSPDGTNDAWSVGRTTVAGSDFIGKDTAVTTTTGPTTWTWSIYAKPGTGNFLGMYFSDQHGDPDAVRTCFDLSQGTVSTNPSSGAGLVTSVAITPAPNGFFRCSITVQFPTGVTIVRPYFAPRSTNGQVDGTDPSSTATVFVFGGQVEQTSAPTAYIATTSVGVTVPALAFPGGSNTYTLGTVVMQSGLNATFQRTVQNWDGTNLKLIAPFPFTLNVGDVFSAAAGCDLQRTTCALFGNLINYGGQPFIPVPETVAT